jgi:hypothetical protein
MAVDLPLSAAADTLTLPITVPAALNKLVQQRPQADPGADKDRGNKDAGDSPGEPLSPR